MTGHAASSKHELTSRQERFVAEYLIDLNATRAAIRAGYSAHTADVQGPRLLGNVRVATAIASEQAKRSARVEITQDQVLKELALVAFSSVTDYMVGERGVEVVDGRPPEVVRALARARYQQTTLQNGTTTVTREVRLWDKVRALALLANHLGITRDANWPIDPTRLSDDQLARLVAGEHPFSVLTEPD